MSTPSRHQQRRPVRQRRPTRHRWLAPLAAPVALAAVTACSVTVAGTAGTVAGAAGVARTPVAGTLATAEQTTTATRTTGTTTTGAADTSGSVEPTDIVLDPGGNEPAQDTEPTREYLPDMPPMGPQVTVTVDKRGVISIARGKPKVVIDEYQDPICPPCADFWEANGEDLSAAVADGKVELRLHSANFLDERSASGDYSTRADASMLAVADLAGPNEVIRWETALYSTLIQPYEDDEVDINSAELGELAAQLGMGQGVTDAIAGDGYRAKALDAAAITYDEVSRVGRGSVPATVSGGRLIDTGRSSWLADLIGR